LSGLVSHRMVVTTSCSGRLCALHGWHPDAAADERPRGRRGHAATARGLAVRVAGPAGQRPVCLRGGLARPAARSAALWVHGHAAGMASEVLTAIIRRPGP